MQRLLQRSALHAKTSVPLLITLVIRQIAMAKEMTPELGTDKMVTLFDY